MDEGRFEKLRAQVDLGMSAREFFENDALQEAFDRLKQTYIAAWTGSAPSAGAQTREELYYAYQAVEFVERELQIMLDNGKQAANEIERHTDE